ncbi:MAG: hypothetical protein WEB28_02485 [Nitrosopumilaceae archaeon]
MKFEYSIIAVLGFLVFLVIGLIAYEPNEIPKFDSPYSKAQLYEMHDVVVHVDLMASSYADEETYWMVRVVEFLKNEKDASHLTIWGNFHEFEEYCGKPNHCDHAIMYLYENKGIYHKGAYIEWIDSDKPSITTKVIECYRSFGCEDSKTFDQCLNTKHDGITVKEICNKVGSGELEVGSG